MVAKIRPFIPDNGLPGSCAPHKLSTTRARSRLRRSAVGFASGDLRDARFLYLVAEHPVTTTLADNLDSDVALGATLLYSNKTRHLFVTNRELALDHLAKPLTHFAMWWGPM